MSVIAPPLLRTKRPRAVTFAASLTALNTLRVIALVLLLAVFAGSATTVYVVPGVGDILTGITAPLLTLALLRRRSISTWVLALIWHALALADVANALALNVLAPTNQPSVQVLLPWTFVIAHGIALVLLSSRASTRYYLQGAATGQKGMKDLFCFPVSRSSGK